MVTEIPKMASTGSPGSTQIQIGARATRIVVISASGVSSSLLLGVGSADRGAGPFQHEPPSPLEMENAIATVEDAVMPLADVLPHAGTLATRDATARQLVGMVRSSDASVGTLSLDDVERVFQRLAAVSLGRPVASSGLPAASDFVGYVLILREFMQHLGFASITVQA